MLASLRREASYGYRIVKAVSECVEISESTLYPILKRLEAGGMLTTHSREHCGRLRKYYQITGKGKARIQSFLDEWAEIRRVCEYIIKEDAP